MCLISDLQEGIRKDYRPTLGGTEEGGHPGSGEWSNVFLGTTLNPNMNEWMNILGGRAEGINPPPPPQLQSSVTEFEFSQEEYRQLQVEFWSRFYACCLQYQEALAIPLGLTVSPHTSMVCLLKKVATHSLACLCIIAVLSSRVRRQMQNILKCNVHHVMNVTILRQSLYCHYRHYSHIVKIRVK